ncbi:MAG: DCC1-like thiol-disulfide oxidoreductase family protein [Thermoleophilia bacterium]
MSSGAPPDGGSIDAVLLVDGACGVCCWVGLALERRVPGVTAHAIESPVGRRALAGIEAARDASWHLCDATGRYSGAAVVRRLSEVTGHSRLARLLRGIEPLGDRVYTAAVRTRRHWSRLVPRRRRELARAVIAERSRRPESG